MAKRKGSKFTVSGVTQPTVSPKITMMELQSHLDLAEAQLGKATQDMLASLGMIRDTRIALAKVRGDRPNPVKWALGVGLLSRSESLALLGEAPT